MSYGKEFWYQIAAENVLLADRRHRNTTLHCLCFTQLYSVFLSISNPLLIKEVPAPKGFKQCDSQLQKTIGTKNHRNQAKSSKNHRNFFENHRNHFENHNNPNFFRLRRAFHLFYLFFEVFTQHPMFSIFGKVFQHFSGLQRQF